MKWITKVKFMRQAIAESVVITGNNVSGLKDSFLLTLNETDNFHPFDTDHAMSPDEMDPELIREMFCEVYDLIGARFIEDVEFDFEQATDKFLKFVDTNPS